MALARALAGEKKWDYYNRKENPESMKAMRYPAKVPTTEDIGTFQNFSDCDVGFPQQYLIH